MSSSPKPSPPRPSDADPSLVPANSSGRFAREESLVPLPQDAQEQETLWVEQARRGEKRAWSQLYALYFERIFRHVTYMVHSPVIAEDLTQEVFANAMLGLHKFEDRSRFSTWLFGISNNIVYKHWRSTGRRSRAYNRVEQSPGSDSPDCPERVHMNRRRAEALKAALETLPDHLREAFVLIDLQEVAPEIAAQRLGITRGNLAVRASRARTRIRKELQNYGWMDHESSAGPRGGTR